MAIPTTYKNKTNGGTFAEIGPGRDYAKKNKDLKAEIDALKANTADNQYNQFVSSSLKNYNSAMDQANKYLGNADKYARATWGYSKDIIGKGVKAADTSIYEMPESKQTLDYFGYMGDNGANGELASGAGDNAGNVDSYAMANAARQKIVFDKAAIDSLNGIKQNNVNNYIGLNDSWTQGANPLVGYMQNNASLASQNSTGMRDYVASLLGSYNTTEEATEESPVDTILGFMSAQTPETAEEASQYLLARYPDQEAYINYLYNLTRGDVANTTLPSGAYATVMSKDRNGNVNSIFYGGEQYIRTQNGTWKNKSGTKILPGNTPVQDKNVTYGIQNGATAPAATQTAQTLQVNEDGYRVLRPQKGGVYYEKDGVIYSPMSVAGGYFKTDKNIADKVKAEFGIE